MADPVIAAPSRFRASIGAAWLQRRLVQRKYALTRDNRYCGGSEDTGCNEANVRYVCYWAGSNHASNDAKSYFRRSYDRGFTWEPEELLDEDLTPRFTGTFAMGFMRGRRFRITRKSSAGGSAGMFSLRMYSKRFIDRWNMTAPFATTAGTTTITVTANVNGAVIKHGLLNGDKVHFNGVGSLFANASAGPVISAGTYAVSDVTDTTFKITASSGPAAPTTGPVPGKNASAYIYDGDNVETEHLYDATQFGPTLQAAAGAAGLPNMIKSFRVLDDNTAAIAVTGSGVRGWARLDNVFNGAPSITYWAFPAANGHADVSMEACRGYLLCQIRNDTPSSAPVFTLIENPLAVTPTIYQTTWPEADFGTFNPYPGRYHARTDKVVVAVMDRYADDQSRATQGVTASGAVTRNAIHFLVGDLDAIVAALKANSPAALRAAFKKVWVHDSMTGGMQGGPSASGSGTPTLDIDGDTVILYYGEERRAAFGYVESATDTPLTPDIMAVEVDIYDLIEAADADQPAFFDDFQRPDGPVGAPYTVTGSGGDLTIVSGQASCANGTSAGKSYVAPDIQTVRHFVEFTYQAQPTPSSWIACRHLDDNNFLGVRWNAAAARWEVYSRIAAAFTPLGQFTPGSAPSAGTVVRLEADTEAFGGDKFRLYVGGALAISDTAVNAPALASATAAAIYNRGGGLVISTFACGALTPNFIPRRSPTA